MRLELEIAHAEPLRWEESLTLEDEALRSAGVRVLGEVEAVSARLRAEDPVGPLELEPAPAPQ